MTVTDDRLLESCETLQKSLGQDIAGNEREWAVRVSGALRQVEESLRQHIRDAEAPGGLFATEVDLTRPSLVRQVGRLRRDHGEFLERATALRKEVEAAYQAFEHPVALARPASELPEPAPAGGIADFGALRQSAESFLADLLQHREREANIAIESVTTDLGAGD
jgi:hypothetical protein